MASIDKRPDGRYRARWREYPGGPQRAEHFARKKDAEVFLVNIQHRLLAGTYTPPEAGRITVAAYAEEWRGRRHWRASTEERVDRELRLHIIPLLGRRPLASLRRSHIAEWAAALPLAPSSVKTAHRTLSSMLGAAVEDERIPRNPASGASLPKVEENLVVPMTVDEVRAVAAAITEPARALHRSRRTGSARSRSARSSSKLSQLRSAPTDRAPTVSYSTAMVGRSPDGKAAAGSPQQ
jgi:hypothetical protein